MDGVSSILSSVNNLVDLTAGFNSSSAGPMNIILDKCSVVLEELRTIEILTETHSEGLIERLKLIEDNIVELDNLFDRIDVLNAFVQEKKSELDKLEKFYNVVDRQ